MVSEDEWVILRTYYLNIDILLLEIYIHYNEA